VREIEGASPRPGETEELKLEAARLDHAGRLLERASSAERALAAEDGAADALGPRPPSSGRRASRPGGRGAGGAGPSS
jgi:DNA repair ATPase RecN